MRPPVVKRQTSPRSGFCPFFSAMLQAKRDPPLATCSVVISVGWCIQCDCTNHFLRVCRHRDGGDREYGDSSLHPRNIAVPSCCPMQKRGSTRQPLPTIAVEQGASAGVQSTVRDQGKAPMSFFAFHAARGMDFFQDDSSG